MQHQIWGASTSAWIAQVGCYPALRGSRLALTAEEVLGISVRFVRLTWLEIGPPQKRAAG